MRGCSSTRAHHGLWRLAVRPDGLGVVAVVGGVCVRGGSSSGGGGGGQRWAIAERGTVQYSADEILRGRTRLERAGSD